MKYLKLTVRGKVIDKPYSPAIPARAEYWVKNEEVSDTEPSDLEGWSYIPAFEGSPEQIEVSHMEIIGQTEGSEEEVLNWLEGDKFKYPEGYIVETEDITEKYLKKNRVEGRIQVGGSNIEKCDRTRKYIGGYIENAGLTVEQVTQLSSDFSTLISALLVGRDDAGYYLMSQVQPDGVTITSELKQDCLDILSGQV